MTLNDLETEISILGNGESVTNVSLFIVSVNRALKRLYTDRRIEKNVRIASRSLTPVAYYKEIHCINGEMIEFPLDGIAYSMRVHGNGRYMITDGEAVNVYAVDSMHEAKLIKGFLSYGGKISFWGSFSFTIYDLAVYDQMFSQYTHDIPDCGPKTVFDLREMYGDFMSFISPATDKYGNPLKNCRLYDGKVEIDSGYEGEIILSYRRLPAEVIPSQVEQIIDVPDEYMRLFTLLVASYYWFYTDESLARYYGDQYEEGIKSLKENSYEHIECSYVDTNGWA